jgi:hypothetical protein
MKGGETNGSPPLIHKRSEYANVSQPTPPHRLYRALRKEAAVTNFSAGDTAPIWEPPTAECRLCCRSFTFLHRRHHCRNW